MIAIARFASVTLVVGALAACNSTADSTCDCALTRIVINVPVDIAASISPPKLTGTACIDITASCENYAGGCSQWAFEPDAAGTCHVELDSPTRTFAVDVKITQSTGCCTGLYASPESAATINVPEPDGGGG